MADPNTPSDPIQTTLTAEDVKKQAQEIADSKIGELKQTLVDSIAGKKEDWFDGHPPDWNTVKDGVQQEARTIAQEEARKALEQERKTVQQETEARKAQEAADSQKEYAKMSAEWSEAVADGILPDINPEVKAKLEQGKTTADLTPEERNDAGLRAFQEVSALHLQMAREGKSNSLYRTVTKFYKQEPAGTRAPVLGAAPAGTGNSGELKYSDVVANRKKTFNF